MVETPVSSFLVLRLLNEVVMWTSCVKHNQFFFFKPGFLKPAKKKKLTYLVSAPNARIIIRTCMWSRQWHKRETASWVYLNWENLSTDKILKRSYMYLLIFVAMNTKYLFYYPKSTALSLNIPTVDNLMQRGLKYIDLFKIFRETGHDLWPT